MKLYLDMNIYNRIFDDQNQIRIRFETMAIDIIGTIKLLNPIDFLREEMNIDVVE